MSEHDHEMPRRDFLGLAWGGMTFLAAAGSGYIGLRFLESRVADGEFGGVIDAGPAADFPAGTVTPFNNGKFYLVRLPDEGFLALYHKCTHLACVVLWDEAAGQFYCPCHGSRFETDGAVLNRPATLPLTRFPVTLEDDQVLVDTGAPIARTQVEPADIVYPGTEEADS